MDISRLDLSLLTAFHAMIEHQNVTRAAQAIGLSQPATSAALARLRELFNDPLFVRTGRGMRPTPLATQLAPPVRQVLDVIRTDILQTSRFDAASTTRTFSIAMPDIGEMLLLPRFLRHVSEVAPGAKVTTVVMPPRDMQEALESGGLDLAYGIFPDLAKPGFFQQRLARVSYVCIARKDHPLIGDTMTLGQFESAAQVMAHPAGRSHDTLERMLQREGVKRNVQVRVSHLSTLPMVVSESDLIAVVTRTAAARFARAAGIKLIELPFRLPPMDVKQYWHRRFHRDAANVWLRQMVREAHEA